MNKDNTPKILYADFEEANRIVMRYSLEHGGYAMIEAVDGIDAVNKVKEKDISLVIMEIRLPNMSGYEAARIIRATHEDMPIIALTSFTAEQVMEEATEAGFNTVLQKPYDSKQLLETIATYLK
ncbi:MAG: response regulator [Candidatus Woesearchaeota archaeon]